ncbi:stress-activated map kinase interacting protein 1-domain-containing protein [Mycena alexandri]|uniref:Stress-activated map kinase interacting protein 1-domain-containing protein n=1 Tax=Mycena alexandri TaxID=1745969 RepID=A0AAD6X5S8_9AGAR|nr:stress-activated map kinase interacting protein 1-domain-containing protein [Mycena alexandri]
MSLLSDTDFLIHSLRLSYLRDVDDPYGARIISLAPAYNSNSYIIAASLNDIDRWPELAMPSSPQLSDDERPSGFPGARLKYTNTIMGGRTGGLGLRVNGKRASTSKRMSLAAADKDFLVQGAPASTLSVSANDKADNWVKAPDVDLAPGSAPAVQIQQPTVAEEAPVAKVVQFIPKFKGAAEMEARRRVRMAARRGPGGAPPPPQPILDFSSSSDEEVIAEDSSDSDFGQPTAADAMDDGDEFDPDFAASRTPGIASDSASDVNSVLSTNTTPSSVPISSSQGGSGSLALPRVRSRLSPVSEGPTPDRSGPYFEMLTPGPGTGSDASPQPRKPDVPPRNPSRTHSATHGGSSSVSSVSSPEMTFARKKVAPLPARPQRSALTALIVSSGESTNPFAELYAAVSGRGEGASTNVSVYFPSARAPKGQAMDLNVRKDATVEEVIGFALWTYCEEGWLPKLDEGMENADEEKLATRLSAVGWIMRIAEEDGEVDDDFPPPDRIGKVAKFNAEAYAVLEATPAQIQQNQLIETKIQRHPSRVTAAKKQEKPPAALSLAVAGSALPGSGIFGSALGASVPFSTSLGPLSGHGPQIFLRIKVEDTPDTVHIATTIPVSAGMYMQEVLERVCRKTKLDHPEAYALLLANDNTRILIPLDRTVASLQGKRELVLIRRTMIDDNVVRGTGKTTDPNASILKRMSDTPEVKFSSAIDYSNIYKQYTIFRKMPMLVAKQERTLAFDGLYIHILPTANKATKAVFDSGKHASYHIRSIADCQQSTKSSAIFKLVVGGAHGKKRYDYEAESAKHASEIVAQIWTLKSSVDRSSTIKSSRRSRHLR